MPNAKIMVSMASLLPASLSGEGTELREPGNEVDVPSAITNTIKINKNKNTMTCSFCLSDLKSQGDVDETGTQFSLTMVVILCVAALVAVGMICGTIVVVVMYKRWSAKQVARTAGSNIPAPTKAKNPKVLKL